MSSIHATKPITFWDTEKDRDEFVEIYEEKRELPSRVFWKLGKLGAVFFFRFKEEEREAIEEKLKKLPILCNHGEKPELQLSEQEEDIAKLLIRIIDKNFFLVLATNPSRFI